ncbi:hypothetical protein K1719_036008 [Acacia pycnantha]|nr:hypothetical protein K1719_036008 [Acacia pycnantha]
MKLPTLRVSVLLLVAFLVLCGVEIDSLALFAVEEHNKKENSLLEFARVLKAKEQVVAGKLYHLTMEASDAGKRKIYEAKVWVKPWMNFKQLEEFKLVRDISPFTTSDLGVKKDGHRLRWRDVPVHDPDVKDAASYAVKFIAQKSNSLFPYQLFEIVLAKAKVVKDEVKFNLLLKVRKGMREERFQVVVTKQIGKESSI